MSTADVVDFITKFEDGKATQEEIIDGFQLLIDTGVVWHLQGSYGRTAQALIDAGHCTPPGHNGSSCPSGQCGL